MIESPTRRTRAGDRDGRVASRKNPGDGVPNPAPSGLQGVQYRPLTDNQCRQIIDAAFILHSLFHEAWSLRLEAWLGMGNDPRYTPSTTFETFLFPDGLSPSTPAAEIGRTGTTVRTNSYRHSVSLRSSRDKSMFSTLNSC